MAWVSCNPLVAGGCSRCWAWGLLFLACHQFSPDKELVAFECLGWQNVGAGPSGSMYAVTGRGTCANECASGCIWVCAGVWGCLLLVHKHTRRVSGILWVPVGSAAAEVVPEQAAPPLPPELSGLEGDPPVQGLGWEVRWVVAPGGTAVWLLGLGDRWPQHSRLCLPSTHAHLSSVSSGGLGAGIRPASAPTTKSRRFCASQEAPSPFLGPAPSSQPLCPSWSPIPSQTWTSTNQSGVCLPHLPVLAFTTLTPPRGLYG